MGLITLPRALTAWTTSNITAGSDTTAILLRTTIYSLLSHPATLSSLLSELDSVVPSSSPPSITFKQTRSLPYLDACIKEAGRLHPPFGLPLERVVPPEGATVCGQRFNGGTVIGMSPWVVHRDKDVYGKDAGVWRPERWLECDNEQRRRMEAGLLTVRFPFFLSFQTTLPPIPRTVRSADSPLLNRTISCPFESIRLPIKSPSTVRSRPPRLHRQKHLLPRSLQVGTVAAESLRGSPSPFPLLGAC